MSEYDDLTVAGLKELLVKRGLPVSGRKADLILRLEAADADAEPEVDSKADADADTDVDTDADTEADSGEDADADEDADDGADGDADEDAGEDADEDADEDAGEDADEDADEDAGEDDFDDEFDDEFEDWDDEESIHTARQKPELDDSTKAALAMRSAQSKKQPKFRRQEWYRYKRLSRTGWRKPKGMDSKQRKNLKYRSPVARVGYGKVADARGLHPSGFREVMVHKPADLDAIDAATEAVRIGARVGGRKRLQIHTKADELGLRILNRRDISERGEA